MKVGDKFYMPTWKAVWQLIGKKDVGKERMQYEFMVTEGENKYTQITYYSSEAFEGELIEKLKTVDITQYNITH